MQLSIKTFFSIYFIFIDSIVTNEAINNAKNNLNNSIKKYDKLLLFRISARIFFKYTEMSELDMKTPIKQNTAIKKVIKNLMYVQFEYFAVIIYSSLGSFIIRVVAMPTSIKTAIIKYVIFHAS